jgi:hypothetical protein
MLLVPTPSRKNKQRKQLEDRYRGAHWAIILSIKWSVEYSKGPRLYREPFEFSWMTESPPERTLIDPS